MQRSKSDLQRSVQSIEKAIKDQDSKIKQILHSQDGVKRSRSIITHEAAAYEGKRKWLNEFLHGAAFEAVLGFVIFLNLIFVILETDSQAGNTDISIWVDVASWLIMCCFFTEVSAKLYVERFAFWQDAWNILDFAVVALDVFASFLGLILGHLFPVSVLRIIRLCKLTRVIKAFRVFPELRLMMAGLVGSMKAIFWGTVLLAFALLIWSIIAVQFVHPLNVAMAEAGVYDGQRCERCPRAYASVMASMLTLCVQVVAADNWNTVAIPIMEHYPATVAFFSSVYLSVGMAVLNLILGVVVDVASQARNKMRVELEDSELLKKMEVHSHLLAICKQMDSDGDYQISKEELNKGYSDNEEFRHALQCIDIHEEDLEVLWTLLDTDRAGAISYDDFVTSCYKMKSSNTQFMLAYIKFYITQIKEDISAEMSVMKKDIIAEEKEVEADLIRLAGVEVTIESVVKEIELETKDVAFAVEKLAQNGESAYGPAACPADADQSKVAGQASSGSRRVSLGASSLQFGAAECQSYLDLMKGSAQHQKELNATMTDFMNKMDASMTDLLTVCLATVPLSPISVPEQQLPVAVKTVPDARLLDWHVSPSCGSCSARPLIHTIDASVSASATEKGITQTVDTSVPTSAREKGEIRCSGSGPRLAGLRP